jgi:hypothetical protein
MTAGEGPEEAAAELVVAADIGGSLSEILDQVGSGGEFWRKRGALAGASKRKRPRDGAARTTTAGLTTPSSLPRAAAPTTSFTDVRINRHGPYMRQRGPRCQ